MPSPHLRASPDETAAVGHRDLAGPEGLTTEAFCDVIAAMLDGAKVDDLVAKYNPTRDAQKKGMGGLGGAASGMSVR